MKHIEIAYWYYIDELTNQPDSAAQSDLQQNVFTESLLYAFVMDLGLNAHYKPLRYCDEWQYWQKNCPVAGIALVRKNPETEDEWENLLVKNKNRHFIQPVYSWPSGKFELSDKTYWQFASREVKEEIGIDLSEDKSKVVAVIRNRRAVSFVLPIAFDDPRLEKITLQKEELYSYSWKPIKIPADEIKLPDKCETTQNNLVSVQTQSSHDLYMAYPVRESFLKLRDFRSFETKEENVEDWLNKDPSEDFLEVK